MWKIANRMLIFSCFAEIAWSDSIIFHGIFIMLLVYDFIIHFSLHGMASSLCLMHKIINPLLICQFVFSSFCKLYPAMCIMRFGPNCAFYLHYFAVRCMAFAQKKNNNVFDFPQNMKFTEDNYVFIVSCCCCAAIFSIVLYSFQSVNNNPFNQSFGRRHSADTRELCEREKNENKKPNALWFPGKFTNANQSIETACERGANGVKDICWIQ